eukprot:4044332-Prymnesium_polylepis.1
MCGDVWRWMCGVGAHARQQAQVHRLSTRSRQPSEVAARVEYAESLALWGSCFACSARVALALAASSSRFAVGRRGGRTAPPGPPPLCRSSRTEPATRMNHAIDYSW